jgi:hypothetical protein
MLVCGESSAISYVGDITGVADLAAELLAVHVVRGLVARGADRREVHGREHAEHRQDAQRLLVQRGEPLRQVAAVDPEPERDHQDPEQEAGGQQQEREQAQIRAVAAAVQRHVDERRHERHEAQRRDHAAGRGQPVGPEQTEESLHGAGGCPAGAPLRRVGCASG